MAEVKLCKLDEIDKGDSRVFKTSLGQIALFRTRENKLFATAARCPHMGGPMTHALFNGVSKLSCPIHGYTFDVENGSCTDETLGRELRVFQVRLDEAQAIHVDKVEKEASIVKV